MERAHGGDVPSRFVMQSFTIAACTAHIFTSDVPPPVERTTWQRSHGLLQGVSAGHRNQLHEATVNTAGYHRHRFVGRFATVRDAFQISPQLVHRQ